MLRDLLQEIHRARLTLYPWGVPGATEHATRSVRPTKEGVGALKRAGDLAGHLEGDVSPSLPRAIDLVLSRIQATALPAFVVARTFTLIPEELGEELLPEITWSLTEAVLALEDLSEELLAAMAAAGLQEGEDAS